MDFLGGLFETKAGRGAAASGVIARATGASFGARNGGQPLGVVGPWDTEQAIKQGYERVIWIFRCVDVIAQNQASRKIIFRDGLDRRTGKVIKDDRLNKVLNFRSNVYESSWQFRYRLSTQLLLSRRGAFIEIVPARDGQPAELHLLPVGQTRPIPDPKTFVSGYEVTRSDNVIETLKPEQVIWVRTKPHPSDNYAQVTPLSVAGIEADTDYLARIFNRNFLMNDGRPGMLITIDPGELNLPPADMEIIKQRFSGGPTAAGQTTVIEAAGISAQDLSASPRDIQWDTLLTSTKERILMAFGVPESVMGNASGRCVDDQTEALTKRGWVNGWDLTTDDEILSVDPKDGRLKWGPVHEVYHNADYNGEMFRLKNAHMDFLVTPGHNWLTTDGELVKVEDLNTRSRLVLMGDAEDHDQASVYEDEFVELVGWTATEGHYSKSKKGHELNYVRIRQNDGPNSARIENALASLEADYSTHLKDGRWLFNVRGDVAGRLRKAAPGKVPTREFIDALTASQRVILMESMIDGDGCRQTSTQTLTFAQKDRAISEAFVYLATLCGYSTAIREREYDYTHKGVTVRKSDWIVTVRSRKVFTTQKKTISTEHYEGLVWCPRTDYGTFVARRNGRVVVTGNTFDNADAERENFWMDTMIPHCDNIAFSLDILTGDINDNKVCAFDYDDVDVLQRVAAARREEWRTEVQQGLRTVNEYFDDAAREPWSGVLRNDVLYLPNGVVVARNPVQQEEANKFVPAKPEGAAGGGESQGQVNARAQTTALNRATAKWGNQIAARLLSGGVKSLEDLMETKGFPKTQKCKYCPEQATKRIIHADGRAYVPVCAKHLAKGKSQVEVDEVRSIPESKSAKGSCKYCGKPGTRYIVNRKNGAKSAVCKDHIKMGKNRTKRSGKGKRADASRVGAVEKKSDHDRDLEVFLDGVLTGWDLRQADVVSQRLVHVKSRKGTRHWDDGIETKALDPRYALDLQQWRSELLITIEEQVYKTIDRTAREVQAQLRQTGDLDDLVQQGQAGKAGDLFTRLFGVGSTERTTIFDNVMKTVGDAADNNSQRILDKITAMDAEGASMAEIQRYVKDTISNRSGWRKMLAANVATTTKEQTKEVLYGAVGGSWRPTWNSAHDERVRASHRLLDGQKRPASGRWDNGCRFPGDPLAPLGETIACRCWTTYSPI